MPKQEPIYRRVNESYVNECQCIPMNPWISMEQWMDRWMNGWMGELLLCRLTSSLSDVFAIAPLLSATFSRKDQRLSGNRHLPGAPAHRLSGPTGPIATAGPPATSPHKKKKLYIPLPSSYNSFMILIWKSCGVFVASVVMLAASSEDGQEAQWLWMGHLIKAHWLRSLPFFFRSDAG